MNNTFKKLLSVFLCVVLLFTTASVAFAADESVTDANSEVTEIATEKTLFDKLEEKINDFWYDYAAFFYIGGYFALVTVIGSVASIFTWPISLVLLLTGHANL